jgi:two-component system CheB/CheR fusion protein
MPSNKNKRQPSKTKQQFPIVGVGASAGGLDAFKKLVKAIPENSGMAYVLVQHLDPSHESALPDILSRETNIPVHEIEDNIPLAPNHIYIIPANKILTSVDGVLKLTVRDKKAINMAVDIFFTSLAEVHGSFAVGVVLSGIASDGTEGLKAIKAYGGITVVQDPKSAAYNAMPQSAINAGVVDFILPPEQIAVRLQEVISSYYNNYPYTDQEHLAKSDENAFRQILLMVQQDRDVDFTYYKQTTLRRRIARRIAINKTGGLAGYLGFLRGNKAELESLFQDLLITVTAFFRDVKVYEELCNTIFPEIIKNKKDANDPVRIWVAGCATGEEAYSIAICMQEVLSNKAKNTRVQVFASDISGKAIKKARTGIYSPADLQMVSESRRKNYFTKKDGSYEISKLIRDMCVFAPHNFLKDPPFAKIDLVSCRNVLIYMDSFLQNKALTIFHYALNDKGFLLLGKSETTGASPDLFAPYIKAEKIYTRKNVRGSFIPALQRENETSAQTRGLVKAQNITRKSKQEIKQPDFRKNAESILLNQYTPAAVIVNEQMDIVHIHGKVTPFLEPPPGKPTFNLLKMAHGSLAFELRNAFHKLKTTGNAFLKEAISVQENAKHQTVTIEIVSLKNVTEPHYLILFSKVELPAVQPIPEDKLDVKDLNLRYVALEKELSQVREDMRSITEEQEADNEELQSANEELQSSNEEMQSLNEELETSKEELQSTNEELMIVNQELIDKQEQLNAARHFAESIVQTIREPLVILDKALCVTSANAAFYKIFHVQDHEAEGKSFFELRNHQWENKQLRLLLQKVIDEKIKVEDYEVTNNFEDIGTKTMLLNARQVINRSNSNELILLAIEDITERKVVQQKMKSFSDDLEKEVKDRTSDLMQSNMQLNQFVYIASHDLQEPLRKILIFCTRLQEKQKNILSADIKTYLNKIDSAATRMRKLIEELLEYSRLITYDKLFALTDLNVVFENVMNDFELMIEEKKAKISSNNLPVIQAIPLQMNQLFYNLISNSLKFSQEGIIPVITITSNRLSEKQASKLFNSSAETTYYEIIFRDNGIGFDQKYAEQIFIVFQRLHQNNEYTGTGIGLSIIKKIIENHQGKIIAEAKENAGATFHIILPAEQTL